MATLAEIIRERDARRLQADPQLQPLPIETPSLDEILQQAAAGVTSAGQEPVAKLAIPEGASEENQYTSQFGKLLDEALGKNWDEEAARILEKQGMRPPTAPGPFKVSTSQAIAALGPALGAIFGGNVAGAAPAAAGVLGGYRSSWEDLQKKFTTEQAAYSKTASDLGEKMAARAEKRLAVLTPILTMTASERARNRIDVLKIGLDERNMTDKERQTTINLLKVGLDREKENFDRIYKQNQQTIAVLELTNRSAADLAKQALAEKVAAFNKWHGEQTLRLEQGKINETMRHNKAQEAQSGNAPDKRMKELEFALVMDKLKQGDMETVYQLVFGAKAGRIPEEDKMALQQYTSIMGRNPAKMGFSPDQVETLRQRANQAAKKMGMPEFPAPQPGADPWGAIVNWFKGLLNRPPGE